MTMLIFCPLFTILMWLCNPLQKIVDGHLTIQPSDFSQRKTLALTGNWSFFWQPLIKPNQEQIFIKRSTLIKRRGDWQSAKYSCDYDAIGFATYHLCVTFETLFNGQMTPCIKINIKEEIVFVVNLSLYFDFGLVKPIGISNQIRVVTRDRYF
jgi:hypothetical protein